MALGFETLSCTPSSRILKKGCVYMWQHTPAIPALKDMAKGQKSQVKLGLQSRTKETERGGATAARAEDMAQF